MCKIPAPFGSYVAAIARMPDLYEDEEVDTERLLAEDIFDINSVSLRDL